MSETGPEPPAYRAAHARDRLASDTRIAALDVDIRIVDDRVFVSGTVNTDGQRTLAGQLVEEELPGLELHNELVIVECREAPVETREHLA
jgi:hypothetical protein